MASPDKPEYVDEDGNSLLLFKHDGIALFEGFMTPKSMADLKDFKVRPDDVWLVGFPKSGMHWMFEVLGMLIWDQSDLLDSELVVSMAESEENKLGEMKSPRLVISFLPWQLIPDDVWRLNCKVVYIYRNPKDSLVSYYHMIKKSPEFGPYPGSFGTLLRSNMFHEDMLGGWYNHVIDFWNNAKGNPNVFLSSYEDMRRHQQSRTAEIVKFLGIEKSHADVTNVAQKTELQNMKEKKSNDTSTLELFRKGSVGNWKEHFTVAENEAFDKVYKEKMTGVDIPVIFEF